MLKIAAVALLLIMSMLAASPSGLEAAGTVSTVTVHLSAPPIFMNATAGVTVQTAMISGFPAGAYIAPNTTALNFSGTWVHAFNPPASAGSNGTLLSFRLSPSSVPPQGLFSLVFNESNFTAILQFAGVCSVPFSTPAIYAMSAGNGSLILGGSGFPSDMYLGHPVVGNYSYSSNVSANMLGAFLLQLPYPGLRGGTFPVRFTSYFEAKGNISVAPHISLFPSHGHVGEHILLHIYGFYPDQALNVSWQDNAASTHINAGKNGAALLITSVPAFGYGVHSLFVNSSNASAYAQFNVNSSIMHLSSAQGSPGGSVTVQGLGYQPGVPVDLVFNGAEKGSGAVLSDGTVSFNLTIPPVVAGVYSLSLVYGNGSTVNSAAFTVRPIVIASGSTQTGSILHIVGSYFFPMSSVSLFISGLYIGHTVSSQNGTFRAIASIPLMPGGLQELYAIDSHGNNATPYSIVIVPHYSIQREIISGSFISIRATGLHPGAIYYFTFNTLPVATVKANSDGAISTLVRLPHISPGVYELRVSNVSVALVTVVQPSPSYGLYIEIIPVSCMLAGGAVYLFRKYRIT